MAIEWSIIDCSEVHNTRNENWQGTGSSASVDLECAYTDRYDLVSDLLSGPREYPFNNIAPIELFATGAVVKTIAEEYTQDGQGNIYTTSIVSVSYTSSGGGGSGSVDPNTGDVVTIHETIEPTIENVTVESDYLSWSNTKHEALKETEAPPVQLRGLNLVRSVNGLTSLHPSIINLGGKVNNTDYTSNLLPGLVFPAETLLFVPPVLDRDIKIQKGFIPKFNLKITFRYNENGWNNYPKPSKLTVTPSSGYISWSDIQRPIYVWNPSNSTYVQLKAYPPADFSRWLW